MAKKNVFDEYKKAKKHNRIEADVGAMMIDVIDELVDLRTQVDILTAKVATLESKVP